MNPSITAVAELYKFDDSLFSNKIGNLENDLAAKRLSDNSNPIAYVAGHLTQSRYHLLELLGTKLEFPWGKLFESAFNPGSKYPTNSEINDAWATVSKKLMDKMAQATETDLAKELTYKLPHNDNTVRGALLFYAYHESWHLGQISFMRKHLGLKGLVAY